MDDQKSSSIISNTKKLLRPFFMQKKKLITRASDHKPLIEESERNHVSPDPRGPSKYARQVAYSLEDPISGLPHFFFKHLRFAFCPYSNSS